jgi:dipeptide/tripeptide permease
MRRLEKPITYNAANVISACVSALLTWLGFSLLQMFDLVQTNQSAGLGFVAAYLLQGVVFTITVHEYHERKKPSIPMLLSGATYILLFAACILLPGLNELTGGNTLSWITLLMSGFASAAYFITYCVLSKHGLNLHK